MKLIKLLALLIATLLLISCSKEDYPPIQVMHTYFGTVDKGGDGKYHLNPTTVIPYKPGQKYAWRIIYRSNQDPINYEEVVILSDKGEWGVGKDKTGKQVEYKEILDGKGIVVKRSTPNDSTLHGMWTIAKNDPKGKGNIMILVNGKKVQEFEFEFKAEDGASKSQDNK